MNCKLYKSLNMKSRINYLVNILLDWKSLGVRDIIEIRRELILNTNNDDEVSKILDIIIPKLFN